MLQDDNTYIKVNTDSRITINNLKTMLTRWKNSEYISDITFRSWNYSDSILPRVYRLPKVHKINCPFRIIISSLDSPLYTFASSLYNLISKNIPQAPSH